MHMKITDITYNIFNKGLFTNFLVAMFVHMHHSEPEGSLVFRIWPFTKIQLEVGGISAHDPLKSYLWPAVFTFPRKAPPSSVTSNSILAETLGKTRYFPELKTFS